MKWWERLQKRMQAIEMTPGQLSEATGIEYTSIPKYLRGNTPNPRGDTLARLAEAVGVSEDWLRTGLGASPHEHDNSDRDVVLLPEYDIRFSAGGGQFADTERIRDMWAISADYAREAGLDRGEIAIAEVVGDSMEPKLSAGDRIGINQSDVNPANPGVFALWDSDALVVKRVEKIPGTDPVQLRLTSDNKNHSEYSVLAEETRIIGRVVWQARRIG